MRQLLAARRKEKSPLLYKLAIQNTLHRIELDLAIFDDLA
jgi:hypothetical protein